jgi:hypothetical protein
MSNEAEEALSGGIGGPGPEDWANGAAILASALVREARLLAETAAALAGLSGGASGGMPRAARRAAVALAASEAILEAQGVERQVARIGKAAEDQGISPQLAAATLRAAALTLPTDDAAARIAATSIAQGLAGQLLRGAR